MCSRQPERGEKSKCYNKCTALHILKKYKERREPEEEAASPLGLNSVSLAPVFSDKLPHACQQESPLPVSNHYAPQDIEFLYISLDIHYQKSFNR